MAALACAAPLNERAQPYLASKHEIVFVAQLQHAPVAFVERQQVSGIDDYLSKPVGLQQLIDLISKYTS